MSTVVAAESPVALRPPLKWAGGKRWQVPLLAPFWRQHANVRLVEPFSGGLAVSLTLQPRRALLNDINPHLVNFYRRVQEGLRIPSTLLNDEDYYYAARSRFNTLLRNGREGSKAAAVLFYYLNRTGYNGPCRFNSSGEFNVPFGRYATITHERSFPALAAALRRWTFECRDFEDLRLSPSDFIYADPPYDVPFAKYSRDGFSWSDQVRAATWLSRHEGPVILSNQATPRVVDLYRSLGFRLRFVDAPRRISCTGDRAPAREVLATRNLG